MKNNKMEISNLLAMMYIMDKMDTMARLVADIANSKTVKNIKEKCKNKTNEISNSFKIKMDKMYAKSKDKIDKICNEYKTRMGNIRKNEKHSKRLSKIAKTMLDNKIDKVLKCLETIHSLEMEIKNGTRNINDAEYKKAIKDLRKAKRNANLNQSICEWLSVAYCNYVVLFNR